MMKTSHRTSFRLKLAVQTMLVSGVIVTSFGFGAWWFARGQMARNLDLRIVEASRRYWSELTPRHRDTEFADAATSVFGNTDVKPVVIVLSHVPPHAVLFSRITDTPPSLIERLPTGEGVATSGRTGDNTARGGNRLRPQMPFIREPVFFSQLIGGDELRFVMFSNPNYSVFIGHSARDFYAEARRSAFWFTGAAGLALLLAGLGSWWLSGRAMQPMERVVRTAEALGIGRLDERIALHGDDHREFARLIAALNAMTDRLQKSFQQAARFTADASHELKTPLAMMQDTLHDLLRDPDVSGTTRERIETMLEDNTRLKHITQSLLLLSQADSGKLPVERRPCDLSSELAGLIEDAECLCAANKLAFHHHIQPGIHIEADPALMRLVFQNLLSNAIKHNQPEGKVSIELKQEGRQAILTLSNTGPAIPPAAQSRLFERFYRTDEARHTDGFGLGLNIASELAKANGAELRLTRSDAKETVFEVEMPA